jgi:hypothetical protein
MKGGGGEGVVPILAAEFLYTVRLSKTAILPRTVNAMDNQRNNIHRSLQSTPLYTA